MSTYAIKAAILAWLAFGLCLAMMQLNADDDDSDAKFCATFLFWPIIMILLGIRGVYDVVKGIFQ